MADTASIISEASSDYSSTSTDSFTFGVRYRMLRSTLKTLKDTIGIVSDVVINKIDNNVTILHTKTCLEHLTKMDKNLLKHSEEVLQNSVILFKESLENVRKALTDIQVIYDNKIIPTIDPIDDRELEVKDITKDKVESYVDPLCLVQDKTSLPMAMIKEHDISLKDKIQQQQMICSNKLDQLVYLCNPKVFNLSPKCARFFVITTQRKETIYHSIRMRLWCSTSHGNKRLDQAFRENYGKGPVYVFFSVVDSYYFCGMAQMKTAVDFNMDTSDWNNIRLLGQFAVNWIYLKNLPRSHLKHICLENKENRPMKCSIYEVPFEKGTQLLKIMHNYEHSGTILDDFTHNEKVIAIL
ncbi:YTHDF [Mytilus coruscus]|uniref:YTHDF n=1 Tax=Mytilus coruscus TaxID=42192 RepID=A0A6J8E8I5_MYTCO|nr:YTHDF [Mytilus coruscus]